MECSAQARRCRSVSIVRACKDERIHGPRHAHVAKPALLFELFGILNVRECGNRPSSSPAKNTSGNSRPFAACSVIIVTRAFGSYWSVSEASAA